MRSNSVPLLQSVSKPKQPGSPGRLNLRTVRQSAWMATIGLGLLAALLLLGGFRGGSSASTGGGPLRGHWCTRPWLGS
jgi:hypothetical protein